MRLAWLGAACVCLAAVLGADEGAQQGGAVPNLLDVLVLDQNGKPVMDLKQEELTVRDNGKNMTVELFQPVTQEAPIAPNVGRAIVIVLDDQGMEAAWTTNVKDLATKIVQKAGPNDAIAVLRMSKKENLVIDRAESLKRIGEYASAGSQPTGQETFLRVVAETSQRLSGAGLRRKQIVWLGDPSVADVAEPDDKDKNDRPYVWQNWTPALSTAAAANVNVYAVDARGRRLLPDPDGFLLKSGGTLLASSNLDIPVDQLLAESANYYMLGYRAEARKELRNIEVRTTRKNLQVRVRRSR